jgi:hypothetical protein
VTQEDNTKNLLRALGNPAGEAKKSKCRLTGMSEEHRALLDELLDLEEGLTAWEVEFIENLKVDTPLTPRQREKLEQIGEERL